MEFTPRTAKYSLMYTSMQFLFCQFFATVLTSCILNKSDIINNNAKK